MRIYCKNYKCKWIRFLETPVSFKFRKSYYLPFEGDSCLGECRKEDILINMIDEVHGNVYNRLAYCCDTEKEND